MLIRELSLKRKGCPNGQPFLFKDNVYSFPVFSITHPAIVVICITLNSFTVLTGISPVRYKLKTRAFLVLS